MKYFVLEHLKRLPFFLIIYIKNSVIIIEVEKSKLLGLLKHEKCYN